MSQKHSKHDEDSEEVPKKKSIKKDEESEDEEPKKKSIKKKHEESEESEPHRKQKKKHSKQDDDDDDDDDDEEDEWRHRFNAPKKLVEAVKKYVTADDKIRELQQEAKLFKEEKKRCEKFILNICQGAEVTEVSITGGKLKVNKSKSKGSLKDDTIKQILLTHFHDPELAIQVAKVISKGRPLNEHINIKRTFNRTVDD